MAMKNLWHPGRIIKGSCLDLLGLSVTEAAKVLGVAHSELWRVLNGHAAVSLEMAIRLEKAGWHNAEHWLHRQTIYNLAQARRNEDQITLPAADPTTSTMPIPGQSSLFSGEGKDNAFLAVRDNRCDVDIQVECERLWNSYEELARPDFVNRFSYNFRACFWEMYLSVLLRTYYPELEVLKSGPDFRIPWKGSQTFVEAISVSRGAGADHVPDISVRSDDDDSVPFDECILRITAAVDKKSKANNAGAFRERGRLRYCRESAVPRTVDRRHLPVERNGYLGLGVQTFEIPPISRRAPCQT